jgi:DNA-binding IclR family transcriptional regulator
MATRRTARASAAPATKSGRDADPLYVRSIEKAFRVLTAFGSGRSSLSLAQVAEAADLDKSAAQRFTHTLEKLGYLHKDPETKRFALTTRALDLGYYYMRASPLAERAFPYLLHLSRATEETVSLTVLDGTEIVYVSRFMSRHMLDTDLIIGSRLPAYCTAAGRAMLSRLPVDEARAILRRTDLKPYTPHTVWKMPDLLTALARSAERGFAIATEEIYPNDISLAAAVLGRAGDVMGAISIAVSKLRYSVAEAEQGVAPMVTAAAHALSQARPLKLA